MFPEQLCDFCSCSFAAVGLHARANCCPGAVRVMGDVEKLVRGCEIQMLRSDRDCVRIYQPAVRRDHTH